MPELKDPQHDPAASVAHRRWTHRLSSVTRLTLWTIGIILVALTISTTSIPQRQGRPGPGTLSPATWTSVDWTPHATKHSLDLDVRQAWILDTSNDIPPEVEAMSRSVPGHLLTGISVADVPPADLRGKIDVPLHDTTAAVHPPLPTPGVSVTESETIPSHSTSAVSFLPRPEAHVSLHTSAMHAHGTLENASILTIVSLSTSKVGALWEANIASLGREHSDWTIIDVDHDCSSCQTAVIHVVPQTTADVVVFCVIYIVEIICAARYTRSARSLRSRWAQLGAVLIQLTGPVVCALALARLAHANVENVPPLAYPLPASIHGLALSLYFLDTIDRSSRDLTTSLQLSRAIRQVRLRTLSMTSQQVLLVLLLSKIASSGLAHYCKFTILSFLSSLLFYLAFFCPFTIQNTSLLSGQAHLDSLHTITRTYPHARGEAVGNYRRRCRSWMIQYMVEILLLVGHLGFIAWHFPGIEVLANFRGRSLKEIIGLLQAVVVSDSDDTSRSMNTIGWPLPGDGFAIQDLVGVVGRLSIFSVHIHPLVYVMPVSAAEKPPLPLGIDASSNLYLWIGVAALSSLVSVRLMSRDALLDFPSEGDAAVGQANISYASFLPQAHVLDVFRLASGPRPFLVSIGFDRRVVLWDLDSQTVSSQRIMCDPSDGFIWPISAASMDSGAKWLAMCTHGGQVVVWSREQSRVCLSMSAGGRLASCLFARMTSQDPLHGPSTHLLLVLEDGVLIDRNIETAKVVTTQICDGRVVSAHVVSKPRTSTQLITIAEGGQLFLSARREGQWFTRRMQIGAPVAGPVKSSRIALVPALRGVCLRYDEESVHVVDIITGQPIHSFRGCSIQFQTLRALHSPPQNCVHCGSTAVTSFSVAYTDQSGPFVMRTMSAENDRRYHTGMICLRSERDVRERRCSTFTPGREMTHVLPDPGVWEASGANAVAGLRKSKSSKQSAGSDIDKMLHRRNSTQRISREGWEAWTMTAKGITNRQSLTASLVTPRTGPACKLARNAVAIGLADLIVLVRFGDRIYAEDEEEGLANKPSHGRLSRQNSQIGRLRRP